MRLILKPVNGDGLAGFDDLSFRGAKRRGIWNEAVPPIPKFLPGLILSTTEGVGMTLVNITWSRY